jgi:hypothetical protein
VGSDIGSPTSTSINVDGVNADGSIWEVFRGQRLRTVVVTMLSRRL